MKVKRALQVSYDSMPQISISRLENDIVELGKIGRNNDDGGVYRMAFSEADFKAREWLLGKIEKVGLKGSMDGAGNVFGLDDRAQTNSSFLIGSHLDSVPRAGVLDGCLGVLAALECMRVIREKDIKLVENLELVATSDEEGRFGGMLGAEAICGEITPDRIRKSKDVNGRTLEDCMKERGLDPFQILTAHRHREFMSGFLELHIEQGPVLQKNDIDIGVVDSISGIFHWKVKLIGEANHSGTTPMGMRKDAFQGLCEFSSAIPRILEEYGSDEARASIGKVEVKPPSPHTVPGEVEFSLVGRDFTSDALKELENAFRRALSAICRRRSLMFEYEEISRIAPTVSDENFVKLIDEQAEKMGVSRMRMPSGAGHDGQFFGKYMPAAMIFIPSLNGISHSPDEWSSIKHIEAGANLLLRTVLEILEKPKDKATSDSKSKKKSVNGRDLQKVSA